MVELRRGEANFFNREVEDVGLHCGFFTFESGVLSDESSDRVRLGFSCAPAHCQHRSSGSLVLPQVLCWRYVILGNVFFFFSVSRSL